MKHIRPSILSAVLTVIGFIAYSQQSTANIDQRPHKIVMQITDGDSLDQVTVVGQVGNVKKLLPNARIEVVCHSNGIDMLTRGKSFVSTQIAALKEKDVTFVACENSMRRKNVKPEELVPVAGTVPSALVEIIYKQEEGWSYIKGGH